MRPSTGASTTTSLISLSSTKSPTTKSMSVTDHSESKTSKTTHLKLKKVKKTRTLSDDYPEIQVLLINY